MTPLYGHSALPQQIPKNLPLRSVIETIYRHLQSEKYRGYDPYDGLMSPLFRLPILRSTKLLRWGFQQVFRRIPINLRPLMGIKKGYNPVTLALALQGYAYLSRRFPERYEELEREGRFLLKELVKLDSRLLQPNRYSGSCWGYDFDWEAQYARIPRFTPTVVATGFVTNALFHAYHVFKWEQAAQMCESATQFVRNDLKRTPLPNHPEFFCWSYSPFDTQAVLNATMKGARLLAQVYSLTSDKSLIDDARHTVGYVMAVQHASGSWSYSRGDRRVWADNFHTGYVLDCLDDYQSFSGDHSVTPGFHKGLEYYLKHFFDADGAPRYYDVSRYPIDSTSAAQAILTLTRFGEYQKAFSVADYMLREMFDSKGHFYYQEKPYYKIRIPYMRWSTAWMFMALSYLLSHSNDSL